MFDPEHLEGASSDLVQSMFQVSCKAVELERVKLQTVIQKEKSELRRKTLEKRLKMSGKAGGQSGPAKNPKKTKQELDDDDFLDDLVTETEPDKRQLSYSQLALGGFVTKGADRKTRLEEMEQDRLEREANELTSQLKKAERAEAQAREKEQWD